MKQPDIKDTKVIEDGARLSKTDFVKLYTEMGYDKVFSAAAWHNVRTSKAGQDKLAELNKKVKLPAGSTDPLTFISDHKEEAAERTGKLKQHIKATRKAEATGEDSGNNQTENKMAKGEKGKIAKDLIAAGETDWKVLVEKAGVAKLYAQMLLRNAKKEAPKEKKAAAPVKATVAAKAKEEPAKEETPVQETAAATTGKSKSKKEKK